jgi:trans-aconitate 2-methyltransferase
METVKATVARAPPLRWQGDLRRPCRERARTAPVPPAVRGAGGLGGRHTDARKSAIGGQGAGPVQRRYAFGDGDLAARRLALLHDVYAPSSSALLTDAVTRSPALAYDLGCGPGYTTDMVADVTRAARTIGLDSSASFVAAATARHEEPPAAGYVEFAAHDVLALPFPAGPADLIFCRLLLAHLADPADVVRRWASQLTDDGVVVVDEIEWIETSHPLLRAHLRLAELMVAASGARMCAGPLLATLSDDRGSRNRGLRTRLTRITEIPVPTATAARLFGMNLAATGDRPVTLALCSAAELATLRSGLADLTASTATGQITWGMRQAAYSHSR